MLYEGLTLTLTLTTSHLSPPTSHLSPLTSHLSPLTSHLSPLTSHPRSDVLHLFASAGARAGSLDLDHLVALLRGLHGFVESPPPVRE